MKVRKFAFGVLAALLASAGSSVLAVTITTNMNGADAEVREEEILADLFGVPQGMNRGANTELASRIRDSNANSGDRSSAMYLKFDISGLTQADIDNNVIRLRMHVRNAAQIRENRRSFPVLGGTGGNPTQISFFNVYGLNNFALDSWAENTLTWYNAPGITPDCLDENSCDNDPGKFNFNSDMSLLGQLIYPRIFPANGLPTGSPVDYYDGNGALKSLIQAAKDAGRTHVTLAVALGINGLIQADGGTASNDFINFNYLFTPKEQVTMTNDTAFDADGGGSNPATGSPFSCQSASVCPGLGNIYNPTTMAGNPWNGWNSPDPSSPYYGRFSPKLLFTVPEPTSVALVGISLLLALSLGRRRK
jgi:hypothetical protein